MISLALALSENTEVLPGPCVPPHRTNPGPDLFRFIMLVLQLIIGKTIFRGVLGKKAHFLQSITTHSDIDSPVAFLLDIGCPLAEFHDELAQKLG